MTRPAKQLVRCPWAGIADPVYERYHDEEWGVPQGDSRALFEKLVLEGFQSGLSWLTILKKRDNFRRAFDNFEASKVARYGLKDVARLMADAGIVRNRLKIDATIDNAKAMLVLEKRIPFAVFVWGMLGSEGPVQNRHKAHGDIAPATDVSKRLSKALKDEGFRFVGPTTVYAFMQSVGMVNDHLVSCHRHKPCSELQRAFAVPRG